MSERPFVRLKTLLQRGARDTPVGRAQALHRLTRSLRDALPPPLAEHCRVADLRRDRLVLATDSAAWATQLRYHAATILGHLRRSHGLGVRSLRVQIAPLDQRPVPSARRRALSAAAATHLERAASTAEDPALRAALRRLARRHRGAGGD